MELAVGQMQIDPGRLDRAVPGRGPGLSATMRHCLDHGSSTRPALTHLTRALIANNGPGDDPGAAHAVVSQGRAADHALGRFARRVLVIVAPEVGRWL